jgi:hypothetical protein
MMQVMRRILAHFSRVGVRNERHVRLRPRGEKRVPRVVGFLSVNDQTELCQKLVCAQHHHTHASLVNIWLV